MPRRNGTGIALLADDTRRRIIALLAVHPRRPASIATELGLSRPAVSRQLRLLRLAGLIRGAQSRIDGRGYVYSVEPSAHGRITAWLAGTEIGLRDTPGLPSDTGPEGGRGEPPEPASADGSA